VLAKGGNVNSGEELQKALLDNPSFKSIYGGSGSELGAIALDTATHTVKTRPLGVYKANGGKPKQVAEFDLGGANFKLLP
jgi:hypothetical protein